MKSPSYAFCVYTLGLKGGNRTTFVERVQKNRILCILCVHALAKGLGKMLLEGLEMGLRQRLAERVQKILFPCILCVHALAKGLGKMLLKGLEMGSR